MTTTHKRALLLFLALAALVFVGTEASRATTNLLTLSSDNQLTLVDTSSSILIGDKFPNINSRTVPVVSFVQEVHKTQSGAATSISQSLTATNGNALLVTCGGNAQAITGVSDGTNTYTKDASSTRGGATVAIYRATNIAGGALTVTCSGSTSNQWNISVAEYAGLSSALVDASTTAVGGASTSTTDAGTLTASTVGDLLFSVSVLNTNTEPTSLTPSSGYTSRAATGTAGVDLGVADQITTGGGSYPTQLTFNGVAADTAWAAAAVSYKVQVTTSSVPSDVTSSTKSLAIGGHVLAGGNAPSISNCGSDALRNGADTAGVITVGGGASVTACTLTFSQAFATAPACVATDNTNFLAVKAAAGTSSVVLTSASSFAGDSLSYICLGY